MVFSSIPNIFPYTHTHFYGIHEEFLSVSQPRGAFVLDVDRKDGAIERV